MTSTRKDFQTSQASNPLDVVGLLIKVIKKIKYYFIYRSNSDVLVALHFNMHKLIHTFSHILCMY